jgi:molybdate transport system ATP-binding protein
MIPFDIDIRLQPEGNRDNRFILDAAFRTTGQITVLFGPSGAGKSTLLLAVLGGRKPDRGRIEVGGRIVFDSEQNIDIPTRDRGIGVVFQDALLFPHLDVRKNVAFGVREGNRYALAQALLEQVEGAHLGSRMPGELSGGERQRVALARALASGPRAILLDEPFSALDGPAREALGETVRQVQRESGVPFLHVTHDITEALRIGDTMLVLDRGCVVQQGCPSDVVAMPASAAAARSIGTENLYRARVVRHHSDGYSTIELGGTSVEACLLPSSPGDEVAVGLRAEDVLISLQPVSGTSARNVLPGTVRELTPRGTAIEVKVETPVMIRALVTRASVRELALRPGSPVHLLIKAAAFHRLV